MRYEKVKKLQVIANLANSDFIYQQYDYDEYMNTNKIFSLPNNIKFIINQEINQEILLPHMTSYLSLVKATLNIGNLVSEIDCGLSYRKARTQDRLIQLDSLTVKKYETSHREIKFIFSNVNEISFQCTTNSGEHPYFLTIKQFITLLNEANIKLDLPAAVPMDVPVEQEFQYDDYDFSSYSDSTRLDFTSYGAQIVISRPIVFPSSIEGLIIGKIDQSYCRFLYDDSRDINVLLPGIYTMIPNEGPGSSHEYVWTKHPNSTIITLSKWPNTELLIGCRGDITQDEFEKILSKKGIEFVLPPHTN